jgi:hypothetical protein
LLGGRRNRGEVSVLQQGSSDNVEEAKVKEEALIYALTTFSLIYDLVKDRHSSSVAHSIKKIVQQAQREINMKMKEIEAPAMELVSSRRALEYLTHENDILREALEAVEDASSRYVIFRDCMCFDNASGLFEAIEKTKEALGRRR